MKGEEEEEIGFVKLVREEIIHSDKVGELRGWDQENNMIVLFVGRAGTENVNDYPQLVQFPKAAIPRLIAFLGRVQVPCGEARELFEIAWRAPGEKHAEAYADYLEHLISCKECIATFMPTDEDIERIRQDVAGYRKGAEMMGRNMGKKEEKGERD